jgi:hypothetical protein
MHYLLQFQSITNLNSIQFPFSAIMIINYYRSWDDVHLLWIPGSQILCICDINMQFFILDHCNTVPFLKFFPCMRFFSPNSSNTILKVTYESENLLFCLLLYKIKSGIMWTDLVWSTYNKSCLIIDRLRTSFNGHLDLSFSVRCPGGMSFDCTALLQQEVMVKSDHLLFFDTTPTA